MSTRCIPTNFANNYHNTSSDWFLSASSFYLIYTDTDYHYLIYANSIYVSIYISKHVVKSQRQLYFCLETLTKRQKQHVLNALTWCFLKQLWWKLNWTWYIYPWVFALTTMYPPVLSIQTRTLQNISANTSFEKHSGHPLADMTHSI